MFTNTRPAGTLFGSAATTAPAQPNPFGATTQSTTAFGLPAAQGTTQSGTTGTNLFGGQQQTSNLFGASTAQNQQQQQQPANTTSSLFGARPATTLGQSTTTTTAAANPAPNNSIFGLSQPMPILGQSIGLGQQNVPRLGPQNQLWLPPIQGPREKSIPEQIQILAEKWSPESSECVFQYYFYNQVPPQQVPFYVPDPSEDAAKWEEALSKKPNEGAIPVLGKGFTAIANRLEIQVHAVRHLQQRLHEINNSLDQIIEKHDLGFATRVSEARRRHMAICQKALSIATKVQTLRNRGYSLDASEEELKKRLMTLERSAFDPAITGRQDEVWARMAGLRARAQMIKEESARRGDILANQDKGALNEEAAKEIAKLLQNYEVQLSHLKKELNSIGTEYKDWFNPPTNESASK